MLSLLARRVRALMPTRHWARLVVGAVLTLAVLVGPAAWAGASGAAGAAARPVRVVPYQFIAKAYTELLGRAPDPAGWRRAVALFTQSGCDRASLQAEADTLVSGAEYRRDYPGRSQAPAVVLTLYRAVLNREPDPAGFASLRDLLARGAYSPRQAADALFATTEFRSVTEPAICNPTDPDYGFGEPGHPSLYSAITTPAEGMPGPDTSEQSLQAALNELSAAGGGRYAMPTRAVVALDTTLTVPGNVTLTTAGSPGPHRYADMAHLVRGSSFTPLTGYPGRDLVRLEPGARVLSVWVDGDRQSAEESSFLMFDVRMLGGTGTTVADDRIGSPYGASDLESDDDQSGIPGASACARNDISGNLFDGYGTSHIVSAGDAGGHPEADGVGVYCPHTVIAGNDFVDISDTAVALFDGAAYLPTVAPQQSVIEHNVVVSAGNSYSFGIVTDPSFSLDPPAGPGGDRPGRVTRAFAAVRIVDNQLWSGTRTHFDVLLSSGSHDLFGSTVRQDCFLPNRLTGLAACGGGRSATGALFTGNTDDGLGARVQMGVYVGGTSGTVLRHNSFTGLVEVRQGTCPKAAGVIAVGPGPGSFAPSTVSDTPLVADHTLTSDHCVTPAF